MQPMRKRPADLHVMFLAHTETMPDQKRHSKKIARPTTSKREKGTGKLLFCPNPI
jgi:hypothetical protein